MNGLTQNGQTVLMYASKVGNVRIIRALLDAGADKEAKNKVGVSWGQRYERGGGYARKLVLSIDVTLHVAYYFT